MKICIDPGHYGSYNPGAVKGYYEARAMWTISQYQKEFLMEYHNVQVVMTRTNSEKDLDLSSRGKKARGCDLFISNHSNACDSEGVDYPVVIRAFDNRNNSEVLGMRLSKAIASLMDTKQPARTWTRKHKGGEYYGVLRAARAVGCPRYYIIEHSFHSNKKACKWLMDKENLKKLAKAEVEEIAKYYGLKRKDLPSHQAPQPNEDATDDTNTFKPYVVKIATDILNVRSGPGANYSKVSHVKEGDAYTITDEKNGWGHLKSGAGWISLDYVKRV